MKPHHGLKTGHAPPGAASLLLVLLLGSVFLWAPRGSLAYMPPPVPDTSILDGDGDDEYSLPAPQEPSLEVTTPPSDPVSTPQELRKAPDLWIVRLACSWMLTRIR